jgi:hypothetical protein
MKLGPPPVRMADALRSPLLIHHHYLAIIPA